MTADIDTVLTRINELRDEVRDIRTNFASNFLRHEVWEIQRTETGRRLGEIEREMDGLEADLKTERDTRIREIDAIKTETDRRYRTTVNLALGAFLSFLGGAGLLILQLVAK